MSYEALDPLLEPVRRVAEAAGERIMEVYQSADFEVETKENDTPLTRADRAAHAHIRDGLRELTPDLPQLCEEGDPVSPEERRRWSRYWLIDPLDGTREFIKRNGEFTVNIALVDGHRPVFGVVHAPALGVTWAARAGGEVRRYTGDRVETVRTRPAPERLTVVVSRSHRGEAVERILGRLGAYEELSVGSSLKICRVAEGAADFYPRFGPTSEWDTAAAQAVLEAAGGRLTDAGLEPLRYNTGESLLNPDFLAMGDPGYDWPGLCDGLPWERRRLQE